MIVGVLNKTGMMGKTGEIINGATTVIGIITTAIGMAEIGMKTNGIIKAMLGIAITAIGKTTIRATVGIRRHFAR
jgi:hypothetical protein